MATPTYVAATSIEVSAFPLAGPYSINVPTGVVDGDLMLIAIVIGNSFVTATTETLPAGWTGIGPIYSAINPGSGVPVDVRFGYRVASSEPASYSVTNGGTNKGDLHARIAAYRGNGAGPEASASQSNNTNPQRSPSVTGTSNDALLIWCAGVRSIAFSPPTQPTGMTLDTGAGGTSVGLTAAFASETWSGQSGVASGVRDGSDPNNRPGAAFALILGGAGIGWQVGSVAL